MKFTMKDKSGVTLHICTIFSTEVNRCKGGFSLGGLGIRRKGGFSLDFPLKSTGFASNKCKGGFSLGGLGILLGKDFGFNSGQ